MLVPAAQIVALLAYVGGPLMGIPVSEPIHTPDLTISIADNQSTIGLGDQVRYEVTVTNETDAAAPVTIKLHLPPSTVSGLQAENAAVLANAIAWKGLLAAGQSLTYSASGSVASDTPASDLSATACVYITPEESAVTCATDINAVATVPDDSRRFAWLAAILLGLLATAGSIWLQKKVTPELLTPDNAAAAFGGTPGRPGGAPSV